MMQRDGNDVVMEKLPQLFNALVEVDGFDGFVPCDVRGN